MEDQIKECVQKYVGRKKVIPVFWLFENNELILPPKKVSFGFKTITENEIIITYKEADPNEEKFWMGLAKLIDESPDPKRCATLRMHSSNGEPVEEWQLSEAKAVTIRLGDFCDSPHLDVDLEFKYESLVHVCFNQQNASETTDTSRTSNQHLSINGNPFHKFLVQEDEVQGDSSNQ
jgi:hypothetical protein